MNVRRQDEASPRLAAGILAAALILPFAAIVALNGHHHRTAGRHNRCGPACSSSALVVVTAVIALRHLPAGTPTYRRLARTKSLARTILLVYLILIVPTALLGIAGQHGQS